MRPGNKKAPTKGSFSPFLVVFFICSFFRLHAETGSVSYGYTGLTPDGNRYIPGKGSFPHVRALDVELPGKPVWIASARTKDGSVVAVSLQDGNVLLYSIVNSVVSKLDVPVQTIPPGAQPVLVLYGDHAGILTERAYRRNFLTHPVVLPGSGETVSIDEWGRLVIGTDGETRSLDLNALPDARILFDERERLLLLTQPTDGYEHGILGDLLEATSVTIVDTSPAFRVARRIPVGRGRVIEGISPIWVDIDGDEKREIIITVSDVSEGARIAVYSEEGELLGSGAGIGRGVGWIHQLAVAPFGENRETGLAVVRTPHTGGVVEFYGCCCDVLTIDARLPGISTHRIGSRNLDTAVACDFDGDGTVELLVPDERFETLLLLSRTGGTVEIESAYPVDGFAVTNITAVCGPGETCVVGVGREDGVLRVWVPYLYL
ncbi:MAG: hypothetical protein JXQ30_01505 [Spirochaetes bacterium]|nr:hypothetical protein [Spirochaetota bacterium]